MKHWKIILTNFLLFLFLSQGAISQELITTAHFEMSTLASGSELFVTDPLETEQAASPNDFKVDRRFRVELFYNRNNHTDQLGGLEWRLSVQVQEVGSGISKTLLIESAQQTVGIYSAWADFLGTTATKNWKIISVTPQKKVAGNWTSALITELPIEDIHMECMVFNDRIVALSQTTCVKMELQGEVLSWQSVKGAVEYDIEWVFIDDFDNFTYNTASPEEPFEFKEPVRVTTYKHSYQMDLIYPAGKVYFRIRPKGYFFRTGSHEVYYSGKWCYEAKNGTSNFSWTNLTNHEGLKTWQYSVAYAENGLSKSAISYYDGTLRARQQLSRMNSTQQVVAAGTAYDYEGRQTVQVIPTPVSGGSLNYFSDLYRDNTGGIFDKTDFDEGVSEPLGTMSGAGRYFSPLNNFSGIEPFRDRIPDAEGYAYSQVKFHHDNTGRPVSQSGIGKTHRMGGGHESYFFYVKPSDRDLRELFGSNVGNATHYEKMISVDQNGQASVAYTDIQGRVIASGLFGGNPNNLLPLDNNPSGTTSLVTSSLMSSNVITTDAQGNMASVTDYYHMNMGSNEITIEYDLASGGLVQNNAIFGAGNCASCMYELTIKLTDPTGLLVDLNYTSQTDGLVYPYVYEKYSGASIDCNSSTFNPSLSSIFQSIIIDKTGAYHIEKVLKADNESIAAYIAANAGTLPGAPDLAAITQSYMTNIVTTGCGIDCQSFFEQECREELSLPISGTLSANDQADVQQCIQSKCDVVYADMQNDLGAEGNPCNMLKGMLAGDVSPGGWVYEEDLNGQATTSNWMLSFPLAAGGNFTPTSLQDLANNWEYGWEDLMVTTHPEYCHYTKCVDLEVISSFSNSMFEETTMAGGQAALYINGAYDFLNTGDPLFTNPMYSSTAAGWLSGINTNYQGTGGSIYDYITTDLFPNNPSMTEDANGVQIPTGSTEYANLVWSTMRTLYLGERFVFYEENYVYSGCSPAYYDHPSANFHDPLELVTAGTSGGYPDFFNPLDAGCPEICNANVIQWMAQIVDECPNLSPDDLAIINENLQSYCLSDCDGVFNIAGMLQMSDLIAPVDPNLATIESILSAECGYSLWSMAIDDTCKEALTYTMNNVIVLGPTFQQNLSLLTSCYATNYGQFITAPGITALPNYLSDYTQLFWDNTMEITLEYSGGLYPPAQVTYLISDIAAISVVNQSVIGNQIVFTIRVTLNNGTSVDHLVNQFSISKKTGGWEKFLIDRVKIQSITGTMCDDVMENPFAYDFDLQSWIDDCIEDIELEATILAQQEYQDLLDQLISDLFGAFQNQCFNNGLVEEFTIDYEKQEYAFTLYYYDRAGNLVQTVPPQGVHIVPSNNFPGGVWNGTEPLHDMKTMYTYNSLGQPIKTQTPDGGTSKLYYNSAQQLRFSQNDHQAVTSDYSYTRFDALGRPIEVGVKQISNFANNFIGFRNDNSYPQSTMGSPSREVTKTFYEEQTLTLDPTLGWNPKDLNTRIASIAYYALYTGNQNTYSSASFYDYDIQGNVKTFMSDNPSMGATQRYKTVDYDYDVYSGKMNEVWYQKDQTDQFVHRYSYDDDNRLVYVETSRDGITWDKDAEYFYYLTGALARMELGDNKVQGIDYAYTMNGWLKGVNSNTLEARRDMGQDGATLNTANKWIARDAFGFSLTYFNDENLEVDYTPINGPTTQDLKWFAGNESQFMPSTGGNLYNGNIRAMVTAIRKTDYSLLDPIAKVYQYDQLQRIKEAKTFVANNLVNDNTWTSGAFTPAYEASYSFDLNGNLTQLTRNGSGKAADGAAISTQMDNFTYNYENGSGGSVVLPTVLNRLFSVQDAVTTSPYTDDIKNGQSSAIANYTYDEIGRLVSDVDEEILSIEWTVTSKVRYITRTPGSTMSDVEFKYDPMGNRIAKIEYPAAPDSDISTTFYVRDAQGNLMATYQKVATTTQLSDFEIYGSSRLGVQQVNETMTGLPNFNYCSSDDNRASAILEISAATFVTGESVQYKLGTTVLNNPVTWGGNLASNIKNLIAAVNAKTVTTDVSATLWHSSNATNTYYVQFTFNQPGNYTGTNVSTYINGSLVTAAKYIPKRSMGYGACQGSDFVGTKRYELSNHLGNVLSVITDRKWSVDGGTFNASGIQISSTEDGQVDYYQATIVSYSDYYPYGMLMDQRHGSNGDYRYGFQGQEKDDEVKGEGHSIHYEFRDYDPRMGRFSSIDRLQGQYPSLSGYGFVANSPIRNFEVNGDYFDVGNLSKEHQSAAVNSFTKNLGLPKHIKLKVDDKGHLVFASNFRAKIYMTFHKLGSKRDIFKGLLSDKNELTFNENNVDDQGIYATQTDGEALKVVPFPTTPKSMDRGIQVPENPTETIIDAPKVTNIIISVEADINVESKEITLNNIDIGFEENPAKPNKVLFEVIYQTTEFIFKNEEKSKIKTKDVSYDYSKSNHYRIKDNDKIHEKRSNSKSGR